jgi:hypothetical protein
MEAAISRQLSAVSENPVLRDLPAKQKAQAVIGVRLWIQRRVPNWFT